jgi:hypothetical protein
MNLAYQNHLTLSARLPPAPDPGGHCKTLKQDFCPAAANKEPLTASTPTCKRFRVFPVFVIMEYENGAKQLCVH